MTIDKLEQALAAPMPSTFPDFSQIFGGITKGQS